MMVNDFRNNGRYLGIYIQYDSKKNKKTRESYLAALLSQMVNLNR